MLSVTLEARKRKIQEKIEKLLTLGHVTGNIDANGSSMFEQRGNVRG